MIGERHALWSLRRSCLVAPYLLGLALASSLSIAAGAAAQTPPAANFGGDVWSRSKLSGDWGGRRSEWAAKGFTIDPDATYTMQGVPSGGIPGADDNLGNTLHSQVVFALDTGKADLWPGGFFKLRLETRWGQSDISKAGTIAPVNTQALFPNSTGNLDKSVFGLTELTFTQFLSPKFAVFGGLLNALDADDNAIAGNARRNSTFLNEAFLLSPVETVGAPTVALGAGTVFIPTSAITGSFSVMGSQETATRNPFENWNGTTLATEWTYKYALAEKPGGIVGGFLYSIDKSRADIFQDPRLFLANLVATQSIPTTHRNTWAFYSNVYQYITGNEKHGWGPFLRAGLSDGDPNPVRWNMALGLGGKGLIPGRDADGWGAGLYYLKISNEGLLSAAHLDDEVGGEVFYNIAITPALHATLDSQWISSARPRQDTAWVLGARLNVDF